MNCARTCLFFLPLVLAARLVCAQDNPPPGPAAPAAAAAKTRALKLGLSAQILISQPFTGDTSQAGPGVIGVYEFLLSPRSALGIEGGVPAVFRGRPDLRARLRPRAQALPPRAIAFGYRGPLSAVRPPAADRAAARPPRRGGHVRRGADGRHRPASNSAVVLRARLPRQPPHPARGRFAQRELLRGARGHPSHLVTAASRRARVKVLPDGLRRTKPPQRRPGRRDVVAAVAGAVGYLPSHAEHLAVALDTRPLQREGER